MTTVARCDFGEIRGVQRTPQGGLRIDAVLTRTGVFRYSDDDGHVWREYRPPETVFSDQSIATAKGAPVTDLHPKTQAVTSDTWKTLAKGHVGDDVRQEGDFLVGSVVIQDADEVALVEGGARREISMGYTATLDPTPGVSPDGEAYDVVQRAVVNNHAALGPVGWGRAGPQVRLRMDSSKSAGNGVQVTRMDAADAKPRVLRVRGKAFRIDDDGELEAAQSEEDAAVLQFEQLEKSLLDMFKQLAVHKANMTGKQAVKDAAKDAEGNSPSRGAESDVVKDGVGPGYGDEEMDPVIADARLAKRAALLDGARKVLGAKADLTGKRASEIRRLVVAKVSPETRLDGIDERVIEGMFAMAVSATPVRNDALAGLHRVALDARADGDDDGLVDHQAELRKRTENRWRRGTSGRLAGESK